MITHRAPPQCLLDSVKVLHRTPALGDQTFLGHVQVQHVEGVVNGLDLPHLDEPNLYVTGRCHQNPVPVILSLTQNLKIGGRKAYTHILLLLIE